MGVNGKARRIPSEQIVQEGLGKTLSAVEPLEEQASEALFDVGEQGGGWHRQSKKLPLGGEDPFGDQAMDMRVEVCGKRAEGLDGAHGARRYVFTLEKLLEAASDALLSGLGEKGEQGAFGLEKPAEGLGNREHRTRIATKALKEAGI